MENKERSGRLKRYVVLVSGLLLSSFSSPSFMFANDADVREVAVEQPMRKYDGIVLDSDTGEPLIGASVILKGTSNGVITDMDGRFSINGSSRETIITSYIGYKSIEIFLEKVPLFCPFLLRK